MKKIPYTSFSTFVFRTPHVSFEEFTKSFNRLDEDESYWQEFLQNQWLQESIFLGSPVLYNEIQKLLENTLIISKEINHLKLSV